MPTNITTDKPWYTPALGLADMLAATGRGVTRGTLGLPGDLESLVRLGVGGKQYLPTSDDFDKRLPPLNPLIEHPSEVHPYDRLGQFYNVPIYGGAMSTAGRGIKKLGGKMVGDETNLGRREFAKKAGAIGLGSTALAKAFKYLDDLEKATPVAKQVEDVTPAAKAASKYKYNSLKEYNDRLNLLAKDEIDNLDVKFGGNPYDNLYNASKIKSQLAKADEAMYNTAKEYKDRGDIYGDVLDAFSPQAKVEMKAFKNLNESVAHRHYEEMVEKGRQSLGSYYRKPPYEDYERMIYNQNSRWVDYLDDYVGDPKIFDNISY